MTRFSRSHLTDRALLHQTHTHLVLDRTNTAELLADFAEIDTRRLYAPLGYSSMRAWCVEGCGLSEDAAAKRIQAARIARDYPAIFSMITDGRLHLSGVVLLAPYLRPGNADALLEAATRKSKAVIEALLAARFPRTETLAMMTVVPHTTPSMESVARSAEEVSHSQASTSGEEDSVIAVAAKPALSNRSDRATPSASVTPSSCQHAPGHVEGSFRTPGHYAQRQTPIAIDRVAFHFSGPMRLQEKYRRFEAMMSHRTPGADMAALFEAALDFGIAAIERTKLAATAHPRAPRVRNRVSPRYVPAHVRRAVIERDGGHCTFMGADGHRCAERRYLEFDHVIPVARGGTSTIDNLRLRCRSHNQHEAERVFGREFMRRRRDAAREDRRASQG